MIYLDNSATTRPFDEVTATVASALSEHYFNPSSLYRPALDVELKLRKARQCLRQAAAAQEYRVVFTSGGTEGANLAVTGAYRSFGGRRTGIVVSAIEHPAVIATARALEKQGACVKIAPVDSEGVLDLQALEALLDANTALVSVMHVSNETGTVQPVANIARMAHGVGALYHADGVQAFLRVPFSPFIADVDLYSISAHKVHGPKGVGALYIKPGVRLIPQMEGGGQEDGIRSGTENVPGILGFAEAVSRFAALSDAPGHLSAMKRRLASLLLDAGASVNGPLPDRAYASPHILNVSFQGVRGEVLLHALEADGIYVSTGAACSSRKSAPSPALTAMGKSADEIAGALRFSLSPLNTADEIETAAAACARCTASLKRFTRK